MEELSRTLNVQIFATDIDQQAINTARLGVYPPASRRSSRPRAWDATFSAPRRLPDQERVVRESVVFALHNTFSDPPFTRLDLLCCRNLLIYLKAELQQQILAVFHYALNPGGLLFLGTSETLGQERQHFSALDAHWRIYRRGQDIARPLPSGQVYGARERPARREPPEPAGAALAAAHLVAACPAGAAAQVRAPGGGRQHPGRDFVRQRPDRALPGVAQRRGQPQQRAGNGAARCALRPDCRPQRCAPSSAR